MGFSFQIAREIDREPLRIFSERLFIQTYSTQNTPENMALYCHAAFSPENFTADFRQRDVCYLIAWVGKDIAAYMKLVLDKTPPGSTLPAGVEIARFYLDSPYHGQGLAHEFMLQCLHWIRQKGYTNVWLGVWPQNPRAVRFYQKQGFEKIGTATFLLGTDPQTDDIMYRVL